MRCENCYGTVAEMMAAKDAEIARLNAVVAAMKETADEANRSYIEHHNTIQALRHQLAEATRKLEEARKDAERYRYAQAKKDCQVCVCAWSDSLKRWVAFTSKTASDYYIDQAIEQGKGGDDA